MPFFAGHLINLKSRTKANTLHDRKKFCKINFIKSFHSIVLAIKKVVKIKDTNTSSTTNRSISHPSAFKIQKDMTYTKVATNTHRITSSR